MNTPSPASFGPPEFQRETGCSDATLEKFRTFEALVHKHNEEAGLVGDSTLGQIWHRHFFDSAQLMPLIPKVSGRMADLGSGAGFPGLVLALLGARGITLFERNTRKAGFLQTAAMELGVEVEILNLTAEEYQGKPFQVLTARALAPLAELLDLSKKLREPSTVSLFLKGKSLDAEIKEAQKDWALPDMRRIPSLTDPQSAILRLVGASPIKR